LRVFAARDRAADLAGKIGDIELGNSPRAALARYQPLPTRLDATTQR
jgi:hypothetical protein